MPARDSFLSWGFNPGCGGWVYFFTGFQLSTLRKAHCNRRDHWLSAQSWTYYPWLAVSLSIFLCNPRLFFKLASGTSLLWLQDSLHASPKAFPDSILSSSLRDYIFALHRTKSTVKVYRYDWLAWLPVRHHLDWSHPRARLVFGCYWLS